MADLHYEDDPLYRAWVKRIRTELIPKLEGSRAVVSIVPDGDGDTKFAVELGYSILMDKPIIAVVRPGIRVPNKLVLVADHIIEADITTRDGQAKLAEAVNAIVRSLR